MRETYDIRFDVPALFDNFGGVMGVAAMFEAAGLKVKTKTLYKQRERGEISSEAIASIIYAASKTGTPVKLENYILERS